MRFDPSMFRFVGFKTPEAPNETGAALLLDKCPEKNELMGDYKITRFCSGYVSSPIALIVKLPTPVEFEHFFICLMPVSCS